MVIFFRILHVGLGTFWAGAVFFTALFLDPAVRASGPAGGAVMGAIAQRRFTETMLTLGALTILSGFWLLWRLSGGFSGEYMGSAPGIVFSIGMLTAITIWCIGFFVTRPTVTRIGQLTAAAMQLPEGPERGAAMAAIAPLRARMSSALRIIASLMAVTILTMAVGRYV